MSCCQWIASHRIGSRKVEIFETKVDFPQRNKQRLQVIQLVAFQRLDMELNRSRHSMLVVGVEQCLLRSRLCLVGTEASDMAAEIGHSLCTLPNYYFHSYTAAVLVCSAHSRAMTGEENPTPKELCGSLFTIPLPFPFSCRYIRRPILFLDSSEAIDND